MGRGAARASVECCRSARATARGAVSGGNAFSPASSAPGSIRFTSSTPPSSAVSRGTGAPCAAGFSTSAAARSPTAVSSRTPCPYFGTETNRTFTPGSEADVTAFGEALPFRSGAFDAVLCTEVLEHVPEPAEFLREVHRIIAPGGALLLTTPQTWGLHEEPYDFYRYTKYGLRYLFGKAGFEVVDVAPTTGTLGTVGQRLSSFFYYRLGGRTRSAKPFAVVVCAGIQLVFAGADRLAGRQGDTINWIVLGRKLA